jgi:hypothetical protein
MAKDMGVEPPLTQGYDAAAKVDSLRVPTPLPDGAGQAAQDFLYTNWQKKAAEPWRVRAQERTEQGLSGILGLPNSSQQACNLCLLCVRRPSGAAVGLEAEKGFITQRQPQGHLGNKTHQHLLELEKEKERGVRKRQKVEERDKKAYLTGVEKDPDALRVIPEMYKADEEFMFLAVAINGAALDYASANLQANRKVVMAAVEKSGCALEYAAEELRADRQVVLAAVSQNGGALEHAAEELRADREVVLVAVNESGCALEHAAEELRADQEVVLAAVNESGCALEHAAEELRADQEVVLAAVREVSPDSERAKQVLEYAARELQTNPSFVLELVLIDRQEMMVVAQNYASELWKNHDFMLDLLELDEDFKKGSENAESWVDHVGVPSELRGDVNFWSRAKYFQHEHEKVMDDVRHAISLLEGASRKLNRSIYKIFQGQSVDLFSRPGS